MSGSGLRLTDAQLRELEGLVEGALRRGEDERLPVLGYGEISLVLAWPPPEPRFACKRLPPFPTRARFDAYRRSLEHYVASLTARGVRVVGTEMRGVEGAGGGVSAYVVQPILPAERLAPAVLRRSDASAGHPLIESLAATAAAVVGPALGLDAQLANWAWDGTELTYIDVSTPLEWGPGDRPTLDLDLLAQAYPALLRYPLRRFVAPGILDTYRDLRHVYLDLAGNLLKERLEAWLPRFLETFNERLDEPLTAGQVRRYYRSDARTWRALLAVRRLDRAWRRRVRRRPYPFLLPGRIER